MPQSKRWIVSVACFLALALGLAGCNGDDSTTPSSPQTSPTPASTAVAPTLSLKDAPLVVTVRHVVGGLPHQRRTSVKAAIGRVVNAWLRAGFVGGDYPRSDFAAAYARFTPGAARTAKRDRSLLTNASLGPDLVDVAARRRAAQVSILAEHHRPQGASARVHLLLAGVRSDSSVVRLRVSGDLYLTRTKGGIWTIFGFDLSRSVRGSG